MSMKIVLEGKVYENPVKCYIDVVEGKVSAPEGFLEILESEMSEAEKKDLACKNHDYWMKYLGVEVGDKLILEEDDIESYHNPFTVEKDALYIRDGHISTAWRKSLITKESSIIKEIIKPTPTLKSIMKKYCFVGSRKETEVFLELMETEGVGWYFGKATSVWDTFEPKRIIVDVYTEYLLHSNSDRPEISLDELLDQIEIREKMYPIIDSYRTYQGIKQVDDHNSEIEGAIQELEDELERLREEIEEEIKELEDDKLVKVFDLEKYMAIHGDEGMRWPSMCHMVEMVDNKIKGSNFKWSSENEVSYVPKSNVREFVNDESLAEKVTVFSKKKYDEWAIDNGFTMEYMSNDNL